MPAPCWPRSTSPTCRTRSKSSLRSSPKRRRSEGMDFGVTPAELRAGLIFYLLLFASLILRAYAQAWIADRLGDPTPANEGRLTLYPVPHVDLLGTVVLPLLCIFNLLPRLGGINFFLAWTRPVPVNPANFSNPRFGDVLCQFAGFGMSVLVALLAAIVGGLLYHFDAVTIDVFGSLITINAMLIVLDCLPIPPLPGGTLLRHWGVISEEAYWRIARWSGLIIIVAFNFAFVQRLITLLVALAASPFSIIFNLLAR